MMFGMIPFERNDNNIFDLFDNFQKQFFRNSNATLPASRDVGPKRIAGGLLAISVGATVLAALAAFGVVRLRAKLRRKRKARH